MTDLLSLVEQIEKSEIGSRDLDARIAEAISAEDVLIQTDIPSRAAPLLSKGVNFYTQSADAALSLVPGIIYLCDPVCRNRVVFALNCR